MRCKMGDAEYALVGRGLKGEGGVVHWHDNELDAHRDAKEINKAGADVRVVPAPGGELGENVDEVRELALGAAFGSF